MIVATHNPSTLKMEEIEILVPNGNFKVKKLVNHKWVVAEANVLCAD